MIKTPALMLVGALAVVGGCFAMAGPGASRQASSNTTAYPEESSPVLSELVGPQPWKIPQEVAYEGPILPEDVADSIQLYQPFLDRFSWRMFIALNWPACLAADCRSGEPDRSRTIGPGTVPTVWEQWMNADDVFRRQGAKPLKWGDADVPPACRGILKNEHAPVFTMSDGSATSHNHPGPSTAGYLEFDKRATGPLIDQHRKWARFESYLNETAYNYVVDNVLYSLEGQQAFARDNKKISFPPMIGGCKDVSIEVKAVWKILSEQDDRSRYHTAEGLFVDSSGACSTVPVALVAMHIMTKTLRNPDRVWSTFEHVDSLCRYDHANKPVSGDFCSAECMSNPSKEGCTPNQPAKKSPETDNWKPPARPTEPGQDPPTQVVRTKRFPRGSEVINAAMHKYLRGRFEKSVWANYQLVSTQWVLPLVSDLNTTIYREGSNISNSEPAPQYIPRIPGESLCNKNPLLLGNDSACIGLVVPSILANSLVETYNQPGASCLGCHQTGETRYKTDVDFSFVLLRAQ